MKKFDYSQVKNPLYFCENRLDPHSDHKYYGSEEAMQMEESDFRYSLNGLWKFHYANNYESTIPGFEKSEYDCHVWDSIRVPAHIQMEGYDTPQYANVQYPWEGREEVAPGEIPTEFNPVASYVRYFEIPEYMKGKRVFISFQGAESGIAVWCNGVFVGYSEDTFTPSEFELTEFLQEGENKLAAQVFKWTAGSWCEDQDFFRFSGIYRDVYLYTIPELHITDLKIQTFLDDDFINGELDLSIQATGKGHIDIKLYDGETIISETRELLLENAHYLIPIEKPELWSAEIPKLYRLVMIISDEDGRLSEIVPYQVGFRRFEMKDGLMLLNGKRIVFKGVNRHEFSGISGRVPCKEDLIKDLVTMKRHNMNAIRTSHYPNDSLIYDLCDKYGLYLIAENNMETHGTWDMSSIIGDEGAIPGSKPQWQPLLLDRVNSAYQRDKNHPSILIWSIGNESYGGSVPYEMSQLFRSLDPTRLVHYEGIKWDRSYPDTSDMESQMYPPVSEIREFLKNHPQKPFICCEYTHAMGNSCGGMFKYTDLTDDEPRYQGGFIWDYIDQSIYTKDRYGEEYLGYGGDFHDRPTDYNFSGNGIVYGGNREPSPKMQEVKFNYQNISAIVEKESVLIKNKNLFINTNAFECRVKLEKEGKLIQSAELQTNVEPLTERSYELPVVAQNRPGEYVITVSFHLKENTLWAEKGYEIAFGQYVYEVQQEKTANNIPFRVINSTHNFGVKGENFDVMFSYLNGGLVSYRYGGKELIEAIPKPNFWRAPTDNDEGNLLTMRYGQWKLASMYLSHKYPVEGNAFPQVNSPQIQVLDDHAEIAFTYMLPTRPKSECVLKYDVYGDGRIQTTLIYEPIKELGDMPEFGVIFKFDADYDQLSWYGLGPEETYSDRCRGGKLGVYHNEVKDNMAQYMVPQECGNKMGVRWAKLTDKKGRGIEFWGKNMNFSALPYTPHEIENARHNYELPNPHYTVIRVAKEQMGIAGDDSWGASTHPEFLIDISTRMEFSFTFKGI